MKTFQKLTCFILCIISVFTLVACVGESSGPVLWKVMGENGEVMYLFGSIHVGIEEMYPLDGRITAAFDECDYLAVEYDIVAEEEASKNWSQEQQMDYIRPFVYTDGTSIKDHIDEYTYELAKEFLQKNDAYYDNMDYMKPAYWFSVISGITVDNSRVSTDYGVDRYLIKKAYENGKTVLEVESSSFQSDLMLSFDDKLYDDMIYQSVISADGADIQYAYMVDVWMRGRDDILAYMNYNSSSEEGLFSFAENESYAQMYEEYNKSMLYDRNEDMTKVADEYLKSGKKVFFVVGAGHICGEDGIAQALKQMGYSVEKVS